MWSEADWPERPTCKFHVGRYVNTQIFSLYMGWFDIISRAYFDIQSGPVCGIPLYLPFAIYRYCPLEN